MPPRRAKPLAGQDGLFPASSYDDATPRFKPLPGRLWTHNKAQLIARYLHEFVFITKHGTYVDLFAGRQNPDLPDSWSVEQVINQQPDRLRLRRYRLFEFDEDKIPDLEHLKAEHPDLDIGLTQGDSNEKVRVVLPPGSLKNGEATFCLLDQRSTECHWDTVIYLANLKEGGYKPELFYFLAQGWLNRTLRSRTLEQSTQKSRDWWARDDLEQVPDLTPLERAELLAARFKQELGYHYATPWPIYKREGGKGQVMFHMIHATDHARAPSLMGRAYAWAVGAIQAVDDEQLALELGDVPFTSPEQDDPDGPQSGAT